MKTKDKIKIIIGIVLFSSFIMSYVIEFPYLNNTIDIGQLLKVSIGIGWGIAVLLFYFLYKMTKQLFERFILFMGLLVLSCLLMPLFASRTNRLFGDKIATKRNYYLMEWSARSAQPYGILDSAALRVDGYRLTIRSSVGVSSLLATNRASFTVFGDSVTIPMKNGGWNYSYLAELQDE